MISRRNPPASGHSFQSDRILGKSGNRRRSSPGLGTICLKRLVQHLEWRDGTPSRIMVRGRPEAPVTSTKLYHYLMETKVYQEYNFKLQ